MIADIIRIQKEVTRLLNKENEGYETQLMEMLLPFVNRLSPYEIVDGELPGQWVVRNKKTLKVIDL